MNIQDIWHVHFLCMVLLFGELVTVATSIVEVEDVILCDDNDCSKCECCHTLRTDTLLNLDLQYSCNGDNVTIIPADGTDRTSPFRLFHNDTCLKKIPTNICDYSNIVSIRIVHSSITSVPSLSCLKHLIVLDLSWNQIETIESNTFSGLTKLRIINLRRNKVKTIGLGTFKEDLVGLMSVLLDFNQLQTAEAGWPLSIRHSFCHFGTSANQISHFTNREGFVYDPTAIYGPGFWDLRYNNMTVWITAQVKIYGFKGLAILGVFFGWGFDLRDNPFACDCKLHTFLKLAAGFREAIWRSYFNVTCASPPHLKDHFLATLPLDTLVCNVTEKCPKECSCNDQPENMYVFVDCRNKSLRALPDELPAGNLKIMLDGNSIKTLDTRPYLSRTVYIDLSRNGLEDIAPEAIAMLQKSVKHVNLEDNALKHLPEIIQNIPFSKLSFQRNPLVCDCKSIWMIHWLKRQSNNSVVEITCITGEAVVRVSEADDGFVRCHNNPSFKVLSIVFGILGVGFLFIVIFLVFFRYEAALLISIFSKHFTRSSQLAFDFDVFVSVEIENNLDLAWSVHTLLPELERKRNLKLYFTPRDMDPGTVAVDELIKVLGKCRTALVLLSESYLSNSNKMYEFSEALNIMVKQRHGRMIIVRNGDVKTSRNGYINAYIRLKKVHDMNDLKLFDKIARQVLAEKSLRNERE